MASSVTKPLQGHYIQFSSVSTMDVQCQPPGDDRRCLTEARVPSFNGEKGSIMT